MSNLSILMSNARTEPVLTQGLNPGNRVESWRSRKLYIIFALNIFLEQIIYIMFNISIVMHRIIFNSSKIKEYFIRLLSQYCVNLNSG
jgi:hypothetical protein